MGVLDGKGERTVRWTAVAIGAAAGTAAAGHALLRAEVRRWKAEPLTLPADLSHHLVPVSDGGTIHAVERGDGPPLVLVHGVTLGAAVWAPQLRGLAGSHRVIAIDQRGHGESLAGEGGYSFERLADDLLEVLEALHVTGAVLVGHSMGGMVSQLLAVRRPDELRRHVGRLVLVATAAGPVVPGPLAALLAMGGGRGLSWAGRHERGIFPGEDLGVLVTRMTFGAHPTPGDLEMTRSMIAAMSPSAMSGLLGPLLSFDVRRRLGGVDLPTTVVVGTRDTLTPPRMARTMAAAIRGAELVVIPGCGHMVMLERADELCELLRRG